mmetsp:Transcript_31648/g.72698  ORF Transcript_31648/g.72698 Transcript_31648/m.72698 type:complete len:215 (+) Transcript_31648:1996-2640(+)
MSSRLSFLFRLLSFPTAAFFSSESLRTPSTPGGTLSSPRGFWLMAMSVDGTTLTGYFCKTSMTAEPPYWTLVCPAPAAFAPVEASSESCSERVLFNVLKSSLPGSGGSSSASLVLVPIVSSVGGISEPANLEELPTSTGTQLEYFTADLLSNSDDEISRLWPVGLGSSSFDGQPPEFGSWDVPVHGTRSPLCPVFWWLLCRGPAPCSGLTTTST